MAPIKILVAGSPDDVLMEVIVETIRHSPDFEFVAGRVVDVASIESYIQDSQGPDVLILFDNGADFDTGALLARNPSLVVSLIALRTDRVRLDLKGIGLTQFLSTLKTLATSNSGSRADNRLLMYEIAPGASVRLDGAYELVEILPIATRGIWPKVMTWISASLSLHKLTKQVQANHLPGLTLNSADIERALAAESERDGETEEEKEGANPALDEARRRVNFAAEELDAAVDSADCSMDTLASLARNLDLSLLEFRALLLCMASELDYKYHNVFGYFNNDASRKTATLGLVCSVLGSPLPVRSALTRLGGLVKWRLLDGETEHLPFADDQLKVDPFVMSWLLGNPVSLIRDRSLSPCIRVNAWPGAGWLRRPSDTAITERLIRILTDPISTGTWVCLVGEDYEGWRAIVESAAVEAPVQLIRVITETFSHQEPSGIDEAVVRLLRAARLTRAVLVFDTVKLDGAGVDSGVLVKLMAALDSTPLTCIFIAPRIEQVIGRVPRERCIFFDRAAPDTAATSALYAAAAAEEGMQLKGADAERLAALYPLKLSGIGDAMSLSAALLDADAKPVAPLMRHSAESCRRVACTKLSRYARLLKSSFHLNDIVLPSDRREQLDELVAHVVNAPAVLEGWNFNSQLPYGRGVAALFAGPSGTGKTMAGQAIAQELNADAFAVDLSRIVSKYIGETEKNLDAVFDDAERASAVLIFDEADALFGKRSEVKDAHDRYANIETAYLLQRMEAFTGVAILTTNFRRNLDQAFLRRLRFVIEFPKPDAAARAEIWKKCLPDAAPVASDVDLYYLARNLDITGGNIRQITLRAAFAAAREHALEISMRHIIAATKAELIKLGMPAAERELRAYLELVNSTAEKVA